MSDEEVGRVVEFSNRTGDWDCPVTDEDVINRVAAPSSDGGSSGAVQTRTENILPRLGKFIIEKDKASIGMLQRVFKIGFNRAARIMDQLAEAGVVGRRRRNQAKKSVNEPGAV